MPTFLFDSANRLAKLRDWIIVAATFNYLVGFLVVASYSSWRGLGIIKALDAQYIVAGLFPMAILLSTYVLLASTKVQIDRLRDTILVAHTRRRNEIRAHRARYGRGFSVGKYLPRFRFMVNPAARIFWRAKVFQGYFVALLIMLPLGGIESLHPYIGGVYFICLLNIVFGFQLALFNLWTDLQPAQLRFGVAQRIGSIAGMVFVALQILFVIGAACVFYVTSLYPMIPMEFGGAANKCVKVVFKDPQVGEAVRGTMPARLDPPQDRGIRMTLEMAGDPFVLSSQSGIWQIARDEIRAMGTCPEPALQK